MRFKTFLNRAFWIIWIFVILGAVLAYFEIAPVVSFSLWVVGVSFQVVIGLTFLILLFFE